MFDTILAPLDGSQLADCVLPHVIAIAHSFDAEITLLRMLEKNQVGASVQLFDLLNWQRPGRTFKNQGFGRGRQSLKDWSLKELRNMLKIRI
jgi:nucleotide-binding universal stress UspA family protein